jgi:hypothetical protein
VYVFRQPFIRVNALPFAPAIDVILNPEDALLLKDSHAPPTLDTCPSYSPRAHVCCHQRLTNLTNILYYIELQRYLVVTTRDHARKT